MVKHPSPFHKLCHSLSSENGSLSRIKYAFGAKIKKNAIKCKKSAKKIWYIKNFHYLCTAIKKQRDVAQSG